MSDSRYLARRYARAYDGSMLRNMLREAKKDALKAVRRELILHAALKMRRQTDRNRSSAHAIIVTTAAINPRKAN